MIASNTIILFGWIVLLLLIYMFVVDLSNLQSSVNSPSHSPDLVHAVVMIAGGYMAANPLVDLSIQSLRRVGGWEGPIYILTDSATCFDVTNHDYGSKTIEIPHEKMDTVFKIKTLKTKLFDYIPDNINNILYMDVDIVVSRRLTSFLNDLNEQLVQHALSRKQNDGVLSTGTPDHLEKMDIRNTISNKQISITAKNSPDFAMFLDAGGHFAGSWVSGVEKWHTGVMWARRGAGDTCMNSWKYMIESGKYDSDQAALDAAEESNNCPHTMVLSFRHLLFAKDYLMMLFRGGQTFTHFTAAGRGSELDPFYKNIVIPRLRGSIRPKLKIEDIDKDKKCKTYKILKS